MTDQLLCRNDICAGRKNGMYTLQKLNNVTNQQATSYEWAIPFKCNICNAVYYSCKICGSTESKHMLYNRSRLARHNTHHTEFKKEIGLKRKIELVNDACQSINPNSFDRRESYEYFAFNELKGDGAAYLVGNAICGTSNIYNNVNPDDITLHLLIAKFVKTLSRIQRVDFAFIMEILLNQCYKYKSSNNDMMQTTMATQKSSTDIDIKINNVTQKLHQPDMNMINNDSVSSSTSPSKNQLRIFFPTNDADIRNRYVIGKRSIVNNLPRPNIEMFNDHSYTSIRQCIAHFLASGKIAHPINLSQPNKKRYITDSNAAVAIRKRGYAINNNVDKNDIMILLGLQWSDAFDPNSSTKSNRGAVWIKTVTFVSNTFHNNNLHDTFPIAIGLKSNNHDDIERRFVEELLELGSGINNSFYCSAKKRYITVHFEIIASLGDQPERREINYLIGGNGKFGAHYLFSADIDAIRNVLSPCRSCTEKLQNNPKYLQEEFKCNSCLLWNHSQKRKMTEYDPPKDYPSELIPKNGKLQSVELSFDILNAVVEYAHDKFEHGEWTEKELSSYLNSYGVNRAGCLKVIEHCHNKMSLELYQDDLTDSESSLLTRDFKKDPAKYCHWRGGPFWKSNLKLYQFVDVLMHLLFLGITKSTREIILKWISETKRINGYKKFANGIFRHIADMSLDWCKLLVAKSGWVSDNYIALARICKWFYYPIIMLQNREEYNEPTLPINSWYAKMCKDWLEAHGYSSDGNVKEMRNRIKDYKNDTSNPPKVVESLCCSTRDINHLIGSLLAMISSIMRNEVTDESINGVEREIKKFLTYLHIIQSNFRSNDNDKMNKKTKPYWLARYNHMSLLNIPSHLRHFGPMINLWEGSNQGEGYLRFVKPKLKNIHSKNWQLNAHCEIINEISLEQVFENHVNNNYSKSRCCRFQNNINSRMSRPKKMYMKYKSVNEILSAFRKNRPISAVRCDNQKFYAVVQSVKSTLNAIPIEFQHFKNISSLTMNFHQVEINLALTDSELQPFDESFISNYLLLLPELDKEGYINLQGNGSYYIIDSDWNELDSHVLLSPPKSPKCKY